MTQGLAFLIWLLCVGISAVLLGFFIKQLSYRESREGFAVYACPSGTNSFISDEGETLCCNGDVVDGRCTGDLRCTLSPKSKTGLLLCSALAESDAAATGANKCPPSMPNYFGSCKTIEGCSSSQPTANGLSPSNPSAPQCILYKTREEDLVKLDSCYNVVENAKKAATCSAAEAIARLPACAAASAAAAAPPPGSPAACPPCPRRRRAAAAARS